MDGHKGLFLVLEGSDGSGKATQVQLLQKRLKAAGYEVEVFAFPRYDQPSSHFIKEYLKGAYGPAVNVNPYTASLFYALDRYEAAPQIRHALAEGKIVLADRYSGSNMAHQGSKFLNAAERRGFFVWAESLEFQMLGIPRPNLNIFLRVPAEISLELIKSRPSKDSASISKDNHEANLRHLMAAVETYDMLCQLFSVDYRPINSVKDGRLLEKEAIHELIWQEIARLLPAPASQKSPAETAPKLSQPKKPAGKKVRNISNTAERLEWQIDGLSLIAAFGLQQAGLAVSLDFKASWAGASTAYKYSVPEGLDEATRQDYKIEYESIIELHKKLYEKLPAGDAKRSALMACFKLALPMGAVLSAKVRLDRAKATAALEKLRTHPNQEIASLQSSLSFVLNQKAAGTSEALSKDQTTPESVNDILDKISLARPDYGADLEALRLIEFNPRNEFELIADNIYPRSSLTREEIMLALDRLSYDQKVSELKKALSSDVVLQLPVYRFDALTSWLTLSELMAHGTAEVLNVQPLTARYGYDVPTDIESAGLEDAYMEIFDLLLSLYSRLQTDHDEAVIQYATAAGSKVRWQGRVTAESLKSVTGQKNSTISSFKRLMLDAVRGVHPLIASQLVPPTRISARRGRTSARKK